MVKANEIYAISPSVRVIIIGKRIKGLKAIASFNAPGSFINRMMVKLGVE